MHSSHFCALFCEELELATEFHSSLREVRKFYTMIFRVFEIAVLCDSIFFVTRSKCLDSQTSLKNFKYSPDLPYVIIINRREHLIIVIYLKGKTFDLKCNEFVLHAATQFFGSHSRK